MLTVLAPAKLNLTLEVLAERPDGYHEIRSVFQTINLCDSLRFQLSQKVTIMSDSPDWAPEKSLVAKAVSLLQETAGCVEGATIEVSKGIPLVSGLGGDSSDAAATLCGLNKLWKLELSVEKLLELATRLGSDVAFFLYGGTAFVAGPLGRLGGARCTQAARKDKATIRQPQHQPLYRWTDYAATGRPTKRKQRAIHSIQHLRECCLYPLSQAKGVSGPHGENRG